MGRLMALMVVAAAALLQNLPTLPSWRVLLGLSVGLGVLLFLLSNYLKRRLCHTPSSVWRTTGRAFVLLFTFCVTLTWVTWRAEHRLSDRLDVIHENVVSRVVFRVTGLVQDQGDSVRFQARVVSEELAGIPENIQVVWRKPELDPQVRPGQVWRAALIFRRPRGALNPHGFDFEGHMLSRNIRAVGRVRGTPKLLRHEPYHSMEVVVARARQHLRSLMRRHVDAMPYGAVLIALAIGDQDSVNAKHWEVFNKTGITHLVSISGSHVTMLAAFGGVAMLWCWKRLRWRGRAASEWIPAKVMAGLMALLVAWLYCLLAGWGVPARRTFFMLLVSGLALFSRLPTSASGVLCLAAAVVTLIDPWSPTATGFWLSFAAVAILLFVGAQSARSLAVSPGWAHQGWGVLRESARLQWLITLAMLPVLAFLFQQVSVSSPLANAVAIPVVTFIVTPLALVTALIALIPGLDFLAGGAALLSHEALAWTMVPVNALAETSWSSLAVAAAPSGYLLLSVIGIAWALQPPGVPVRWVGWILLLPVLTWQPERPPVGGWHLSALDVGQGSAILIQTHNHTLLFDTGPRLGASDAGQRVIAPVMRALGLNTLDALVVSHADIDHVGGLPGLLKEIAVRQVYTSFNLDDWLAKVEKSGGQGQTITRPLAAHICEAGYQWLWDRVTFTILHPLNVDPMPLGKQKQRKNENSCVLHIQGQHHSALLTGDIGVKQEADILDRALKGVQADIVVVGHHGSPTSSSQRFVNAVGARHAIAQAGYLNRFSHPAPEVMRRWQAGQRRFWRTDEQGAVTATSETKGLHVYAQSSVRQRYWHARAKPPF